MSPADLASLAAAARRAPRGPPGGSAAALAPGQRPADYEIGDERSCRGDRPGGGGKVPRHVLVSGSVQDDDLGLVEHLLLVPGEFRGAFAPSVVIRDQVVPASRGPGPPGSHNAPPGPPSSR